MKKLYSLLLLLLISFQINAQSSGNFSGDLCQYTDGSCDNREDLFSITVPHDGKIQFNGTIELKNTCGSSLPNASLNAQISYTNNNGDETSLNLGTTNTNTNPNFEWETLGVLAGSVVDLKITMSGATGCFEVNYSLNWNIPKMTYNNDAEPNDNASQAKTVSENTSYEGHGGFDPAAGNAFLNGDDWYKLIIPRNGVLNVDVVSDQIEYSYFDTEIQIARSYADGTPNYSYQSASALASNDGAINTKTFCVQKGDIIYLNFLGKYNSYQFSWNVKEPTGFIDIEPNNESVNATEINIGETKTGNLGYGVGLDKQGFASSTEDIDDWYKFTTTDAGEIAINLTSTNPILTLSGNFFKKDDDGNLVSTSLIGNQADGYVAKCTAAGTYYVNLKVNSDAGGNFNFSGGVCDECCTTYEIEVLSTIADFMPDTEPNDTFADATPISENVNYEGQLKYGNSDVKDFYKLTPSKNGILGINFSHKIPTNNFVALYYKSGNRYETLRADTYITDGNGKITYTCIGAGQEYYIQLTQDNCLSYEFNYSVTTNPNYNEIEPNDSKTTAQIFNADETIYGQLSYGQVFPLRNSDDYFKIPVAFDTPLKINLSVANGTSLFLYESDKSSNIKFIKQTSSTGPITTFTYNNIDATKDYYLNLKEFDGFCSDYELTGWSQGFTFTNDAEPNNSIIDAIDINLLSSYKGQLNFGVNAQDTEDFYSFVINETDDVEFLLNASEGLIGTAVLTVYDSDNNQVYQLIHDGNNSSKSSGFLTKNNTNLAAGSYYIKITGTDQTGSYEFKVTPQKSLSTQDYDLSTLISIYPNPANNKISIKTDAKFSTVFYGIYDITGKLIKSKTLLDISKEIDITHLQSGIYIISITADNKSINKRFVKQ